MTNEEIIETIRDSGYPDDLTDTEINKAIERALRDLKSEYPLIVGGSFTTVQDQRVYDLFNLVFDEPTRQGVFPGGLRVHDLVYGNFGCDSGSGANIFGLAPFFQSFAIFPVSGFRGSFFTPGDWTLWDLDWAALQNRFSPMDWEHTESRYGSPIRLLSHFPAAGTVVLVQFSKPRTLETLQEEDPSWFLLFVEAQCCTTLANKFSCAAGVEFQGVKDTGITRAHWMTEARRKNDEAWRMFEKRKIDGIRSERRWH